MGGGGGEDTEGFVTEAPNTGKKKQDEKGHTEEAEDDAGDPSEGVDTGTDEADDDIVARQLREAAEKETDPDLKEKLWQEYEEYKKNTGN